MTETKLARGPIRAASPHFRSLQRSGQTQARSPSGGACLWAHRLVYNFRFCGIHNDMEAEQLNAIARRLQDLSLRNAELRRYL